MNDIVEALNLLPEYREELIRMQAEMKTGELKRIDALMEQSLEMETLLEERKVQADAEGNEDEIKFLDAEIERCQEERKGLILERAEWAGQELQIRFLLELLDQMAGKERKDREWPPECKRYEDFFKRTAHQPPDGLIDGDIITRFDNDLVIRYVDKVTVEDGGFEVRFKAGISVRV